MNDLIRHEYCIGLHYNQLENEYLTLGDPQMDGGLKIYMIDIVTPSGSVLGLNRAISLILPSIDYINDPIRHEKCIGLCHNQLGMEYLTLGDPQMDGGLKIYIIDILTPLGASSGLGGSLFANINYRGE